MCCQLRYKHKSLCSSTGLRVCAAAEGSNSGALVSVDSLLNITAAKNYNFPHVKPPFLGFPYATFLSLTLGLALCLLIFIHIIAVQILA